MDERLSCGHATAPLHDLIDGLISGPARRAVEIQIVECAVCRQHHGGLADLAADFGRLEMIAAPPDLAAATMAAIRAERRRRSPFQLISAIVAAIVVMGGVALTFSPAETASEIEPTAVPNSLAIVVNIDDPMGAGIEVDGVMIGGLCLALAGSAFLLSRLIEPQAA